MLVSVKRVVDYAVKVRVSPNKSGLVSVLCFMQLICMVWFAWFGLHGLVCMVWFGLVWFGLVWFGLVWFGLISMVWFAWFGLICMVWFAWLGLHVDDLHVDDLHVDDMHD